MLLGSFSFIKNDSAVFPEQRFAVSGVWENFLQVPVAGLFQDQSLWFRDCRETPGVLGPTPVGRSPGADASKGVPASPLWVQAGRPGETGGRAKSAVTARASLIRRVYVVRPKVRFTWGKSPVTRCLKTSAVNKEI